MLYIENVKIKKSYRNLKKNLVIPFKDITLLVGEQGCGKSSLLNLLQKNSEEYLKVKLTEDTINNGVKTFYFDSEKMNPRLQSMDDFTNPNGTSRGIGVGGAMISRFKSHGEVLREYTVNMIHQAKDCILLMDEPESALSLKNQYKLANEIIKGVDNNVQFIIATHCLPLISSVKEVYSLEHNKWMSSDEFIKISSLFE